MTSGCDLCGDSYICVCRQHCEAVESDRYTVRCILLISDAGSVSKTLSFDYEALDITRGLRVIVGVTVVVTVGVTVGVSFILGYYGLVVYRIA